MNYRPNAAEVALLVVYMAHKYDEEKGKATTRFRVSASTLRRLSGRYALRGTFIEELENEIAELGWSPLWVGNNLALIRTDTMDGWPRIASKRIADVLKRVEKGDQALFTEIEMKLRPARNADEDADGEE